MTVKCMDCRSFLYEKCPDCGATCETTMQANLDGLGMCEYHVCPTLECEMVLFQAGHGGVSHGICAGCLETRRAVVVTLRLLESLDAAEERIRNSKIQDSRFQMGGSTPLGATR